MHINNLILRIIYRMYGNVVMEFIFGLRYICIIPHIFIQIKNINNIQRGQKIDYSAELYFRNGFLRHQIVDGGCNYLLFRCVFIATM